MAHAPDDSFAAFEASLLGAGLPGAAARHLDLAAANYRFADIAEAHLRDAQEAAPGHAAVLIGRYRFHFYKGQLGRAQAVAQQCLDRAACELGLPPDWRQVRPAMADFGDYAQIAPRFFLFALKGHAYLCLRLGQLSEGREALHKLIELDPTDKIGAQLLLEVLTRAQAGADE